MVTVKPFAGLRYNPSKTTLQTVVAPPYDVISSEHQQALYDRDPHNIVRLILGHKHPTDSDTENVYTRAHSTLETWRQTGAMAEDSQPAFYGYQQTWQGITRQGFLGLLKVTPFDAPVPEAEKVLPHEWTLGGPKADRLALFKATGSILSPIFCLYDDTQHRIDYTPASNSQTVTDDDGVVHTLWPITDPGLIETMQAVLAQQSVLIADGHHRYETALAYRDWRRERDGQTDVPEGQLPWDYTMAFFTNMSGDGLRVYPTHRVFDSYPAGWSADKLQAAVTEAFEPASAEVDALFWLERAGQPKQPMRLKAGVSIDAIPTALRDLDVALLDQLIFADQLGTTANDLKQQGHLHFIRDEAEIETLLKTEANTLVFWVHAPDVQAVKTICASGTRMPQKSTYFYPKLLSGLVLYYYGPEGAGTPADSHTEPFKTLA